MDCRKCSRPLPDGALFCPFCGAKQVRERRAHSRGNGMGTVYKRGSTWYAQITVGHKIMERNGELRLQSVRATKGGFPTKRAALEYIPVLREESSTRKPERARMTFAQIYDAWHDQHAQHVGRSTMNCYRAARKFFAPLDGFFFDEIDLDDLQECVDDCPNGRRTKENMKALAGLLCKYALPRHQTDLNYAEFIDLGKADRSTHPAFSREQVDLLRCQLGRVPGAEIVYTLIYTGFRPTELLNLRKGDYRDGVLYGGIKTAAGRDRAVPVSLRLRPILDRQLSLSSDYLFPRPDMTRMTAAWFRENYFYQVLAAAGIQKIPTPDQPAYYVPYSCRHTFSNLIKNAAGSEKDKAGLMGHAEYRTTVRHYQSVEIESLRAIIDQL